MPELNFVSTSAADAAGAKGLLQQPYLATVVPGYSYGGVNAPAGDGFMEYGAGTPGTLPFRVDQDGTLTAGHLAVTGSAITAAAGTGAGTGAPAPVVTTGSNDNAGTVTFGTGTSAAPGDDAVAVTYSKSWTVLNGGVPHVVICPGNAATAQLFPYVNMATADGFQVGCQNLDDGHPNTTYSFSYIVIG